MDSNITPHETQVSDSLWESVRQVSYTILIALGPKNALGIYRPGAKMDLEDGLKLAGYMTGAILFDEYAIKQGWYKRSLIPKPK